MSKLDDMAKQALYDHKAGRTMPFPCDGEKQMNEGENVYWEFCVDNEALVKELEGLGLD